MIKNYAIQPYLRTFLWALGIFVTAGAILLSTTYWLPSTALAQTLTLDMGGETAEGGLTGRIVQLVLVITALSLAPSLLVMVTSFTRIVVVLSLLRSALGTAQTPPNMVLVSLALFLTLFVMAPVLETAWQQGVQPMMDGKINEKEAFEKTVAPFRTFMLAHTREGDLRLFMDLGKVEQVKAKEETPITVLIPAFMISELHRAFEIGFLLFLPFLIIDMVIASVLMSMGMMMLPPIVISLPFKIIFFVLVDGWYLVAGSLVRSYGGG
jgi:flagellar biosynthetic protein FliP